MKIKHDNITVQGIKFLQILENINPWIVYALAIHEKKFYTLKIKYPHRTAIWLFQQHII